MLHPHRHLDLVVDGLYAPVADAKLDSGDDVGAGELEDEHDAVRVNLEERSVTLIFDRQGEFFPDFEIRIITHKIIPFLMQVSCSYSIMISGGCVRFMRYEKQKGIVA